MRTNNERGSNNQNFQQINVEGEGYLLQNWGWVINNQLELLFNMLVA